MLESNTAASYLISVFNKSGKTYLGMDGFTTTPELLDEADKDTLLNRAIAGYASIEPGTVFVEKLYNKALTTGQIDDIVVFTTDGNAVPLQLTYHEDGQQACAVWATRGNESGWLKGNLMDPDSLEIVTHLYKASRIKADANSFDLAVETFDKLCGFTFKEWSFISYKEVELKKSFKASEVTNG